MVRVSCVRAVVFSVDYTVTDGSLTDVGTLTINVMAVNDAPVISGLLDQTINEGSTFGIISLDDYVEDIDHADNLLTWYASSTGAIDFEILSNNRLRATLPADTNWHGVNSVRLIVSDGDRSDTATVVFTVTNINDAPVLAPIENQGVKKGEKIFGNNN